jgi:ssRNA-specific RNase YbeY (16S rRNA maturation enzyme)
MTYFLFRKKTIANMNRKLNNDEAVTDVIFFENWEQMKDYFGTTHAIA